MAIFIRKAQLACEIETTEATPNPPDAADAGIVVYDINFAPDVQIVERDSLRATLGQLPHLVGRTAATITGRVELVPSGTAGTAPSIGKLLQICGLTETVVPATSVAYAPDSDAGDGDGTSGTVDFYVDGLRFRIFGARGNVVFNVTGGEQGFAEFTLTGLMDSTSIADAALLAGVSYPSVDPPVFIEATVELNSDPLKIEAFSLDAGNNVALRPDVTTGTGYSAAAITGRDPSARIDPEIALKATRPDYSGLLNGTPVALDVSWGTVVGNRIAFSAPGVQVKNIDQGDREGVMTDPIELGLREVSGDDEWSLTFT